MSKLAGFGTITGAVLLTALAVVLIGPGLPARAQTWGGASASGLYLTVTPSKTPPTATPAPGVSGSITVVGVGKVKVVPDVVSIQVGVETISDTVAAATTENDRIMAAVLAALKNEGVVEKDIQTAYYSIYPEYERRPGSDADAPAKIIGYRVSNSVTVTIHDTEDMKTVSAVLEAVVEAGANSIGGITFSVEDLQDVEDQARKLAVADAKRRAQDLADLTEVKLGRVLIVSEVISGPPDITRKDAVPAAMGGGPSIMPGEQEYSVSIQVTYAIE